MVDRGEVAGRNEDESGTLGSVVEGFLAHGGKPALVADAKEIG
jgi:hypothetical protein